MQAVPHEVTSTGLGHVQQPLPRCMEYRAAKGCRHPEHAQCQVLSVSETAERGLWTGDRAAGPRHGRTAALAHGGQTAWAGGSSSKGEPRDPVMTDEGGSSSKGESRDPVIMDEGGHKEPLNTMIRDALAENDMEAASALGFNYTNKKNGRLSERLVPAVSWIQAHARGRLARKRVYESQEGLRHRWIEYHLSAGNPEAARLLGWERPQSSSKSMRDPVPAPLAAAHRSTALDFPRFFAACHVALYHAHSVYPREQLSNPLKWGFSWVNFFFILSGFVLLFSKHQADLHTAAAPRARLPFTFCGGDAGAWLWKRWIGMYPLLLLSVLLATWGSAGFSQPRGMWLNVPVILCMGQSLAWELRCTDTNALCAYTVWNEPAWFVSSLFFCWLAFPPLYRAVTRASLCGCLALAALLYALALWDLIVWRALNSAGATAGEIEQAAAILARNPVMNLPKFALGAVLARLLLLCCFRAEDVRQLAARTTAGTTPPASKLAFRASGLPFILRYAATPTCAALTTIFTYTDPDTIQGREAITVGLYSLLIVSLAAGVDPLARLLQIGVLHWWGRLAYPLYILHGPILGYASTLTMNHGWVRNDELATLVFAPLALVISLIAHVGVEKPAAAYFRHPPVECCTGQQGGRLRQGGGNRHANLVSVAERRGVPPVDVLSSTAVELTV